MYKDHETPRFWKTYSDELRRYVQLKVQDTHAVDDIMHEVYLKVFCYCKRYDFSCEKAGVKNLGSWIFRICHNVIIDHLRQNSRYTYTEQFDGLTAEDPMTKTDQGIPMMHELISKLPPKYAEALIYDSVLLMKQAEIAHKLGLSLPATKSRIQRGKKMLRDKYRDALKN